MEEQVCRKWGPLEDAFQGILPEMHIFFTFCVLGLGYDLEGDNHEKSERSVGLKMVSSSLAF